MISIKTNIGQVVQLTVVKLQHLADTDKMLRNCATTALAMWKVRIHSDGLDANGQPIGTYSKGYMVLRTGAFKNAARVSRGKNKGKLKDAGVFTKRGTTVFTQQDEETVTSRRGFVKIGFLGNARPRYNRTSDTKVVASLTRQMENDEKVIAIPGGYGIGFTNALNFQKSQWVEATYKKKGQIFSLASDEINTVTAIAEKHTTDALS